MNISQSIILTKGDKRVNDKFLCSLNRGDAAGLQMVSVNKAVNAQLIGKENPSSITNEYWYYRHYNDEKRHHE